MRALITGASGFVGPFLADHLRACGDDVVALDRADGLDVTDRGNVTDVVRATRPDAIYHLAARSHVGESWDDPSGVFRVNVEGTVHVLGAAHDLDVGRVLMVGSAEVYGRVEGGELPIAEDAPLRPTTPYGASKAAAEMVALQAFLGGGVATIRVRPFNHTGPGQSDRFLVPALAARVADAERRGASSIVVGATDPVRDLLDVRDVVRAYRLLVEQGEPGDVYNVCRGTGVSVRDIVERLLAASDRPLETHTDPALLRPVDNPVLIGDPAKLRAATGWQPELSIERTLADVLQHARQVASER
jgi:GDP-4-dehydro-6-deoxy-D-mannose reductase